MRTAAAATALGLTLIVAAGLAACTPEDPVEPTDAPPSSTPVFASEEEALAAAEELYGKYLAASDAFGVSGWTDISLIEPYVRGDALTEERESAEEFAAKGYRQTGQTVFDTLTLQQVEDGGVGVVEMTIYVCIDVSGADIVDASGQSIAAPDRPLRLPLEVGIDDLDGSFKVNRSDAWSGQNFC
jgi:hypothetical protein